MLLSIFWIFQCRIQLELRHFEVFACVCNEAFHRQFLGEKQYFFSFFLFFFLLELLAYCQKQSWEFIQKATMESQFNIKHRLGLALDSIKRYDFYLPFFNLFSAPSLFIKKNKKIICSIFFPFLFSDLRIPYI